jgi:hypothetical protein
VADSSKDNEKETVYQSQGKITEGCSVKWEALMGQNMTAKFYLPFPASLELNNINWLVRSAGESGMWNKAAIQFVCPSAWQEFEAGPAHTQVFITVSFYLKKPVSQIMVPLTSCQIFWLNVTSRNLREENRREDRWTEVKRRKEKQEILQSYKGLSNTRYIIPPTLC